MSKTPLELLREIEWSYLGMHRCPICRQYSDEEIGGHADYCQLAKAISLLEARPEPGEWTKGIREKIRQWRLSHDWVELGEKLNEACDRIDRLEQTNSQLQTESERLKNTNTRFSDKIDVLMELVLAAKCPCCDGSGAYHDNYGQVCQCQWCDERSSALTSEEAEK